MSKHIVVSETSIEVLSEKINFWIEQGYIIQSSMVYNLKSDTWNQQMVKNFYIPEVEKPLPPEDKTEKEGIKFLFSDINWNKILVIVIAIGMILLNIYVWSR